MKPWNLKVKKIGRGYFFIALICCLFLTGTGELLTIMTPHSEKVRPFQVLCKRLKLI